MMLLLEVKQTLLGHCFGQMNTSGFRKFQRRCSFRHTLLFIEIQFWFGETIAHGVQGGLWTRGYGMDHGQACAWTAQGC